MRPKIEKFYVTEEEKEQIGTIAEKHHLTKSAYIRYKIFGQSDHVPFQNAFASILLELQIGNVDEQVYKKVHRAIKRAQKALAQQDDRLHPN